MQRYTVTITIQFDAETDAEADSIADRIDTFVEHGTFCDGLSSAEVDPAWTYTSGASITTEEIAELDAAVAAANNLTSEGLIDAAKAGADLGTCDEGD